MEHHTTLFSQWFLEHQYAKSDAFLASCFATLVVLHIATPFIILTVTGDACPKFVSRVFVALFFTAYTGAFIFFLIRLRGAHDAFGLKMELCTNVSIAGACWLVWGSMTLIPAVDQWQARNIYLSDLVTILGCLGSFYVSVVRPIADIAGSRRHIAREEDRSRASLVLSPKSALTLEAVLSSPEGFNSFKKFLVSEFSGRCKVNVVFCVAGLSIVLSMNHAVMVKMG